MLTWLLLLLFVKDFPLMNATALDGFNYANSVYPLWEQVDYFSKMLESIMNQTSDSIILLCFSQGMLDFENDNTMYKNVLSISSGKKWGGKLLFHSSFGFCFFSIIINFINFIMVQCLLFFFWCVTASLKILHGRIVGNRAKNRCPEKLGLGFSTLIQ